MSPRLANLILAGAAVISSYILLLTAYILPNFFAGMYRVRSLSDLDLLIPPVTQFAVHHAWAFVLLIAMACGFAAFFFQRSRAQVFRYFAIGLSAQALIVWIAMLCFCYDGLSGPMSMHHDSGFELGLLFFQFAFGIFPVTLCAIVAPGLIAFLAPSEPSGYSNSGK